MKKCFLLFLFVISCANLDKDYICANDSFDLKIEGNLSKTQIKQLSNIILNESAFRYDKFSSKKVLLKVSVVEAGSMLSADNTLSLVNVFLNMEINVETDELDEEGKNKIVYKSYVKITDTTNFDSQKRYISILNRRYAYNNLFKQAGRELDARLDILLNSCLRNK